MYEISLRQKEVLKIDNIEELQKLIDKKQRIIQRIDQIDDEIKECEVIELTDYDKQVQTVLKKIYEIDQENKQLADNKWVDIKQKLRKVRQGKKVHKAYNPSLSQAAFFNKLK